jgi:hypothetical protein
MPSRSTTTIFLTIVFALFLSGTTVAEDGWYDSLDGTYRVRVPELLTGPVETEDGWANPGITCQVLFTESTGWYAGITSTKIRPDYPKDDSLLDRIEAGQTQRWGALVQGSGRAQFTIGNGLTYRLRIAEAGAGVIETRKEDGSVERRMPDLFAVAVFVVKNGYLYEFDYAIPQPAPEDMFEPEKIFEIAEENVRKMIAGFTPVVAGE